MYFRVMDELEQLIASFHEKHGSVKIKYAVLTIPIIEDHIYLAERNTPPLVGLYSLVGGKVDPLNEDNPDIEFPVSPGSYDLRNKGFERLKWTCFRELLEEMYNSGNKLSRDEIKSLYLKEFSVYDHVTLRDCNTGVECYTKILTVPNNFNIGARIIRSKEFNVSEREIGRVEKVSLIPIEQINPLSQIALHFMEKKEGFRKYSQQIPQIKTQTIELGDGSILHFGNGFRFQMNYRSYDECNKYYFDYDLKS